VARFLSPEWFESFQDELSRLQADPDWPSLDLGQEIRGAPGGAVCYTIHVTNGTARIDVGTLEGATITLVEEYESARAIASGASVSDLLSEGKITMRGDANALLSAQAPLGAIAKSLGELARATEV